MFSKIAFLSLTITLAGCATLSKDQCQNQDWRDYAKIRTRNYPGSFKSVSQAAIKACQEHQITPNLEALKLGYVDGMNSYCQAKNIWDLGYAGKSINILYCPVGNRAKLQRIYNAAKELNEIEALEEQAIAKQTQINSLQNEAYSIESELDAAYRRNAPSSEIDKIKYRLNSKRSEMLKAQNELASLQLKAGQLRRRARTYQQVF